MVDRELWSITWEFFCFMKFERPNLISIEDPQEPTNDIGKNSFNFALVRSAFAAAYSILTDARTLATLGHKRSILGLIIRPDPTLLERKAGVNGELTFDALFPGAGDPVVRGGDGREMLFNWQSDSSDDAFPRNNRKGDKLEKSLQKSIKKKKLGKRKGEDGGVASCKSKHRRREGKDFAKESQKKIKHSKAESEGGGVKMRKKKMVGSGSGRKDWSRDTYRSGARSWAPY